MVLEVLSFLPPSATNSKFAPKHISCSSANTDTNDFDPFLQSPHDMGDDNDTSKDNVVGSSSAFGFVSHVNKEEDTAATAIPQTSSNGEFDPLLSPHDYINGADEAPVSNDNDGRNISNRPFASSSVSSSSFGFDVVKEDDSISVKIESSESVSNTQININDEFDPLLSPHAYANGVDKAPVSTDSPSASSQEKIGILLIDHGSKRSASNEHIMNVARMYEKRIAVKEQATSPSSTTIVRAAHMEIAPPSILDSIRNLIVDDKVSKVICVPYFLSPGKHAMEDVPQLIDEAKLILSEEGKLNDADGSILVSHALGTHMDGMLSVVDDLVDWTLKD